MSRNRPLMQSHESLNYNPKMQNVISARDVNFGKDDRKKAVSYDFHDTDSTHSKLRVSPAKDDDVFLLTRKTIMEGKEKVSEHGVPKVKLSSSYILTDDDDDDDFLGVRHAAVFENISKSFHITQAPNIRENRHDNADDGDENDSMIIHDFSLDGNKSDKKHHEFEDQGRSPFPPDASVKSTLTDVDSGYEDDVSHANDDSTNVSGCLTSVDTKSESSVLARHDSKYIDGDEDTNEGSIITSTKSENGSNEHDYGEIKNASSLTTVESRNCKLPQEILSTELERYRDQSPQFQALLEYRVRVVLINPLFLVGSQNDHDFSDIYHTTFRKNITSTGFSSAVNLCKAMPLIVNSKLIDTEEKLCLLDSSLNTRILAGIRSGLRRIVYNILLHHPEGISVNEFEGVFFNETGKTLSDVLKAHAYSNPKAEYMIHDMLDIACMGCPEYSKTLFLSEHAEDPALTDGLLIGTRKTQESINQNDSGIDNSAPCKESMSVKERSQMPSYKISKTKFEGRNQRSSPPTGNSIFEKYYDESAGLGGPQAYPRLLVSKGESHITEDNQMITSEAFEDGKPLISCEAQRLLQARLYLRVLLACSGNGIAIGNLGNLFEKSFSTKLNLEELGFAVIEDLIECWKDIILQMDQERGVVFLQPSTENIRIIQSFATGLRETVFSILLSSFPDGMDIFQFVQCLQRSSGENLPAMLKMNLYLNDDNSDTSDAFEGLCNLQNYCSKALRLLVHDMSDFARFGCQDDGSLVIKLRCEDFPLLDFPGYDLHGAPDEKWCFRNISKHKSRTSFCGEDPHVGEAACISNLLEINAITSDTDSNKLDPNSITSFIGTKLSVNILKHQLRLILGSPLYLNSGIPCERLSGIYKGRTGQSLLATTHHDVNSLACLMPDIMNVSSATGNIYLKRSKKNKRILSVVKSGTRQILYWCLLKNPAGIWDELLEGWYSDFVGKSLVISLCKHGYRISRKSYLKSVSNFLEDMSDLVCHHSSDDELYVLASNSDDPTIGDARLLGMLPSDIQYDPLREIHDEDFGFCDYDSLHLPCGFAE